MIHSTAIVSSKAEIESDVEIGAYSIIHDDVVIGKGSRINPHAIVLDGARIGENVTIDSFCSIACLPQDLGFDPGTATYARIKSNATIRESSTVSRATVEGSSTVVGEGSLLMAVSHVAHDCVVGDDVVMANNAMLAGFVSLGAHTFIGGGTGIHQFCKIGPGVMIGGNASITLDVPPFTMTADRNDLYGLNVVGLRRRGHNREAILSLKNCYKDLYSGKGKISEIAARLIDDYGQIGECRTFLEFFMGDKRRGFARPSDRK